MVKASFINGQYLKPEEASVKINDLGLLRGFSIFDFCRAKHGRPIFLKDHLQRFRQSAQSLGLPFSYSDAELMAITAELGNRTKAETYGIRFLLTGGYSSDGFSQGEPNLIILTEEFTSSSSSSEAVKLMSHEFLRELPEIKTTNYITAIMLQKNCESVNAYDILYKYNGKVLELTRSNFFLVKGNTLITASNNVLKGITRKAVIKIAMGKFEVEERDVYWEELLEADEAFLTSTGKRIIQVAQVDDISIGKRGKSEVSQWLSKELNALDEVGNLNV